MQSKYIASVSLIQLRKEEVEEAWHKVVHSARVASIIGSIGYGAKES